MTNIIDGKFIANEILYELKEQIETVKHKYNIVPTIAIVLVGDDPASNIYVNNKIRAAERVGIKARLVRFEISVSMSELLEQINILNQDPEVSGIIVQLPLPLALDKNSVILSINPSKDVDGFHPINVGYLHSINKDSFVPCTALGCLELIKRFEPNLVGKNVVMVGRSNIVGKPLAALLLKEDCTVTICHSKTVNLAQVTSNADIVVAAVGMPHMFGPEYFNQNSLVIDVGISRISDEPGIFGDVDFKNVRNKVRYITPVPGGVGPMTVAFLLKNTFKAMLQQHKINLF
jgi:methylenetetrahydrofolate dehydrogenase (NADP+)/methenyltetrahydrofolate cyclohydrolase